MKTTPVLPQFYPFPSFAAILLYYCILFLCRTEITIRILKVTATPLALEKKDLALAQSQQKACVQEVL